MRLLTTIQPRRDGKVLLHGNGQTFEFLPDENGDLTCDVTDEAVAAAALRTGEFEPVDAEGNRLAEALLMADHDAAKGEEEGDEDEDLDVDAPPVEANTPPAPAAPSKRGPGRHRKA